MKRTLPITLVVLLAVGPAAAQAPGGSPLDRARALELNTPYVPPTR
jgi:hypothetical protein